MFKIVRPRRAGFPALSPGKRAVPRKRAALVNRAAVNPVRQSLKGALGRQPARERYVGRYLGQRNKHKGPLHHARMRNGKALALHNAIAEQQQIQIKAARPEANPAPHAAQFVFKRLEAVQQGLWSQRQRTGKGGHLVQEKRLSAQVLRFGSVQGRLPAQAQSGQAANPVHGQSERGPTVAQLGTQTYLDAKASMRPVLLQIPAQDAADFLKSEG
jgi:hypothetical protein